MKRAERHHLKENELAHLAASARDAVGEHGAQYGKIAIAVIVVAAVILGYFGWQRRTEGRANAALAIAVLVDDARVGPAPAPGSPAPPGESYATNKEKYEAAQAKFKSVADQYPSTDAGLFARYREAGAWMALGNAANAAAAYQQVVDRAGSKVLGQMAKLGLAETQVMTGQTEPAINTFKEVAQLKDGSVPVDGVLMRLARVQLDAGKTVDAEQTLNRIVQEFPDSPFTADARRELDLLKKS